jgi:hypothetical protein
LYGERINSNNQTVVELDFGERVVYNRTNDMWASLDELLIITYDPSDKNLTNMDMVYDLDAGRLYIIGDIVNFTEPLLVNFEIMAGAVTDMVGNPSAGACSHNSLIRVDIISGLTAGLCCDFPGATYNLTLWPQDSTASLIGSIMSKTFLSSTSAFAAFGALGMLAPQSLVSLVGQANSLYWMGQMSPSSMPESFRSFTNEFNMLTLPWR